MMEPDNGEPRFIGPGGEVCRPDQLRFRLERHFLHPALDSEENRRVLLGEAAGDNWPFWAVRKARLWLEWDPERRTWEDQRTAAFAVGAV